MSEGGFFKASSPQEACGLLAQYGKSARLLAGGTDLMVAVNRRQFKPEVLIYLGDCGLDGIKEEGGSLVIGAATTFSSILDSDLVRKRTPLLAEVVSHIASPAVRNMGTIGGNLANASPAADSATALLALGATLRLVHPDRQSETPVAEFFTGPGETILTEGEMITEVVVPFQAPRAGWAYRKLGKRKAQTLSVVSVAVYCPLEGDVVKGCRIALGAVAPTPILATRAAELLEGQALNETLIAEAARAATEATAPIDDVRGTAWYRRRAAEAVVKLLLGSIAGG
jgi:CO/xanthine dehydrogenase FAD-binding subunit